MASPCEMRFAREEANFMIHDVDMRNNAKDLLYQVELKKIQNLKIRTPLFIEVLRFEYQGAVFSFKNFLKVRPALDVIEEESRKQ